ncbi:MAG: hypothetical protein A3E07_02445 [Candidatus Wildermuthbacteria bacterium RIFCSPHIGHO2_12_FULL_45_9]|nr:MAG: hypothetical protein A2748_01360 [Candidatus Wildermuthbacteria bacterium RIFCSPHIGHO2_01_FULL_45_20]OHA70387.1 MAG: hypothetical protein A3E07_02445 [Candidatus Wildermuthbacteria bacterium RIFCSPHIGHO2_12_FULL_45_9]
MFWMLLRAIVVWNTDIFLLKNSYSWRSRQSRSQRSQTTIARNNIQKLTLYFIKTIPALLKKAVFS